MTLQMNQKHKYNFVFFGTPRFAEIILSELIKNGLVPSLVICNPDKPVGRKKIVTPPPTKTLAEKHNIKVLQPESLREYKLPSADYDFALVAAYGKIIPKEILELFKNKIIGIHPSLLPKYRGATPIQSAILNNEKETGVTLFIVDEKVDHGEIVEKKTENISISETYASLEERLAKSGAKLFIETIENFLCGKIIPQEQNHSETTLTKKFETEDGFISEEILQSALEGKNALTVHKKICALNPEPGVFTMSQSNGGPKRMKLLESEIKDGKLILKKIQIEGKKPQVLN